MFDHPRQPHARRYDYPDMDLWTLVLLVITAVELFALLLCCGG